MGRRRAAPSAAPARSWPCPAGPGTGCARPPAPPAAAGAPAGRRTAALFQHGRCAPWDCGCARPRFKAATWSCPVQRCYPAEVTGMCAEGGLGPCVAQAGCAVAGGPGAPSRLGRGWLTTRAAPSRRLDSGHARGASRGQRTSRRACCGWACQGGAVLAGAGHTVRCMDAG